MTLLRDVIDQLINKDIFIFDLDGTVINTEPLHEKALINVLKSHNIKEEIGHDQFVGLPDSDVYDLIGELKKKMSYDDYIKAKNSELLHLLKKENLDHYLNKGIRDFFKYLNDQNKKVALVTASEEEIVRVVLKEANIADYFNHIVYRQKTFRSKPSCSPYLYALRKFQAKSSHTVIFEDSLVGIQSALETKCKVIGVKSFTHNCSPVFKIENFIL